MEQTITTQTPINEQLAPLAEKIRACRWDKKLTIPALAEQAGVSTVLLTNLEKNKMDSLSIRKLVDVANAVGQGVRITFEPIQEA